MKWSGRIYPSHQRVERSNMIEKYGFAVYSQVTECWYVTFKSTVALGNLGLIGSKKYI